MSYEEMLDLTEILNDEEAEVVFSRYLRELGIVPQLVF